MTLVDILTLKNTLKNYQECRKHIQNIFQIIADNIEVDLAMSDQYSHRMLFLKQLANINNGNI